MTKNAKAVLFLNYVNQMIAGKRLLDPVEDRELARLIKTAQCVYHTDFSAESKIRGSLWRQLQEHLLVGSARGLEDGELSDEELSGAAAAVGGFGAERCPLCGAFSVGGEICSLCHLGK